MTFKIKWNYWMSLTGERTCLLSGHIMNEFMMCCMEKNEGVFSCNVEELMKNVAYK
jgi:hypothetical protein